MYRKLCTPLVVAVGSLFIAATLVPTVAFGQASRATVVRVEGATKTFQVQDMDGRLVEVELPSQSLVDIRTNKRGQTSISGASASTAGTIPAKVVAVDTLANKVKVQTQAGQTIELEMPAKDIQIGDQLTLVVPK
jgi:hypothetical protein